MSHTVLAVVLLLIWSTYYFWSCLFDRNTSSQLPHCSPSSLTWKRFYYNNLSAYSSLVDLILISVT